MNKSYNTNCVQYLRGLLDDQKQFFFEHPEKLVAEKNQQ
jgi:hypothetical protein